MLIGLLIFFLLATIVVLVLAYLHADTWGQYQIEYLKADVLYERALNNDASRHPRSPPAVQPVRSDAASRVVQESGDGTAGQPVQGVQEGGGLSASGGEAVADAWWDRWNGADHRYTGAHRYVPPAPVSFGGVNERNVEASTGTVRDLWPYHDLG